MRSHTKGFEVEHQSGGTDGSLISKLEMGMINALGQLHPTRAPQSKLASVYIDVYERVWSGVVVSSTCLLLMPEDTWMPLPLCR